MLDQLFFSFVTTNLLSALLITLISNIKNMSVWIFNCRGQCGTYNDSESAYDLCLVLIIHHDVIKWKHFPRYWPFVRGIHRSSVNSPHKGQWRGALMFSLICARINCWVNKREAGDFRRHRVHYDFSVVYNWTSPNKQALFVITLWKPGINDSKWIKS